MGSRTRQLTTVAAAAVLAVGVAGCGGGDGGSSSSTRNERTEVTQGGTLHYLQNSVVEHTDPQRIYTGRDIANLGRTVYRGLTAFPTSLDPEEASTPVPDLATDIGTSNDDASQWQFTLKDGVTWQDGSDITCEDLKYGVSRTFAQDIITGGPNYIIGYLDIPKDDDGSPAYKGPYDGTGQDLFDKAVTCDGNTITYRFNKPWPDFPLAIASLTAFAPFKESEDQGAKDNLEIFSNGPYMLKEGTEWSLNKGGTLVRNPEWDDSTDDIREANPEEISIEIGDEIETINDRLIADSGDDQYAVTSQVITPAQYSQITGAIADRAVTVDSPYNYYLVPNFNRIKNVQVREALAMATNKQAYTDALGGEKSATPADSIVNSATPGYQSNPAFADIPAEGDVDAARQLLEESGEDVPYPITLTYPKGSDATEKAFAALQETYNDAGFDVTLEALDPSGPYYDTIQKPDSDSDLIWGGWGADWPSIGTVIPPLFDSRTNLSAASNGNDYGNYTSDELNEGIDEALVQTDLDEANSQWAELDQLLGEDVAYIPLNTTVFYMLAGSGVENYVTSASTSAYPDLAVISLVDGGE